MKKEHINKNSDYVVTKTIPLVATKTIKQIQIKNLSNHEYINKTELVKNKLKITYDVSKTSINLVITILKKNSIEIRTDLLTRFKIGWFKFLDQNIHDNANHKPHCCNKPPKM